MRRAQRSFQKTVVTRAGGVLAALTLTALLPGAAGAQARGCDRACLTHQLDVLLDAMKAHDPSRVKFEASVKYTENGQRLNMGDGLWRTFTAGPLYRFDIVDVERGQIAMLGILEENGNRNFFSIRLAVEKNEKMGRGLEITEVENLVVRAISGPGASARPAAMAMVRPEFNRMLPPTRQLDRGTLERIADSYFTGLDTDESAAHVPFAPTCRRLENGGIMANSPSAPAGAMQRMGCGAQFDTGFSVIVTDVRGRRFPVIDREKGLVYALTFFDHNGSVANPVGGDTGAPSPFRQPFSFQIAEVFQIEDARINQIEAVLAPVPYKMESGW